MKKYYEDARAQEYRGNALAAQQKAEPVAMALWAVAAELALLRKESRLFREDFTQTSFVQDY